ncbi:basic salivary proline-rich protein 2-like [Cervus canadensis]|uniref:basic salivary proline-rich protein 2-like n=1 Tax=Cervus canadensis TaxID=1574408 RepID=UPI001C9E25A4|nr:basic salivary proline-rich protein 2-like [Cervus canadensis]
MAVELVIVSTRVQSANYTAYKPSTGRPRARSSQTVRSADAVSPSRRAGGIGPAATPHFPGGDTRHCRGARPRTRVPRSRLRAAPQRLSLGPWGCAGPPPDVRRTLGEAGGQRSSGNLPPAGSAPTPGPGDSRGPPAGWPHLGHRAPDPASPARDLPSSRGSASQVPFLPFPFPSALLGPAPTSLSRARPAPGNFSSVLGPNPSSRLFRPRAPRRSEWPSDRGRGRPTALGTPRVEGAGRARGGRVGEGRVGAGRTPPARARGGRRSGRGPGPGGADLGKLFFLIYREGRGAPSLRPPLPPLQETPGPPPSFQNPSPSWKTACWSISWLAPGF